MDVGQPQPIAAKQGLSGIIKQPAQKAVTITKHGLTGDAIVDLKNHGGVDQAVYVYCQHDYDWWRDTHLIETHPGLFGENLTITGISTADAHVGARLVTKNCTLEITSHRTPCETLAARMGDKTFPNRFLKSHRTGFYCRVITEGKIEAGEAFQSMPYAGEKVSVPELITWAPYTRLDPTTIQRMLSTPIHNKLRKKLEQQRPPDNLLIPCRESSLLRRNSVQAHQLPCYDRDTTPKNDKP